ncbi:LysR family transcriptional regulator [Puerhibacterium puerhi]|uniref:LysR family transcriptional regulator n=1 Tax=Puerhibacterium puerhi TaxID=2692623 RepID=UPI0013591EEA|nr:LysR family transcriptional regulator [Puerhibacterium puerhi]
MDDATVRALLPHLPVLVALGEVEHVTLAAAMLGMPQPTVSRTVRRLEQRLGTPLLEPAGRGVRLTPAARALVPFAQRALDEVSQGLEAMESVERRVRGTVRIAFQTSLGEQLVPEAIRAVHGAEPAVRFGLSQGARQACLDALRAREADVALVSRLDPAPPGLDVVHLFDEPLVLLVPRAHPLAAAGSARVADLAREPLVTLKPGYGLRGSTDELFARAGVLPTLAFEGEDLHTLEGLVAAGLGVAVAPRAATPPADCAQVPLDDPRAVRDIGAALLPGRRTAAVDLVLDALVRLTAGR